MTTNIKWDENTVIRRNSLALKLENYLSLTASELEFLDTIASRTRRYGPREDVVREGEPAGLMRIMLSGWAYRYKHLPDGRRQTLGFFLPGDICDLHIGLLKVMDHSLATITHAVVAEIEGVEFETLISRSERLKRAFQWESLVNMAIQREWTLNLGQRSAFERIAHLLCELYARLEPAGLATDHALEFPLIQTDLADASGISAVHVNRTLKELRATGLIKLEGRMLLFPDMARLRNVAAFDPRYLHLGLHEELPQ